MKIVREAFSYIVGFFIIIALILFISNQFQLANFSSNWYDTLSSVSTSVSAIATSLLLVVTFGYLLATRNMVNEMKRQREIQEEPIVSVKILPDVNSFGFLNIVIKNTGGGPAYDVSIKFEPDLPYFNGSLNELRIFKHMPFLDKFETIEFFFDSANRYFNSDNPKTTTAYIQYYKNPPNNSVQNEPPIKRIINIDIEERKGQLQINRNGLHDLVKEIEELKQGVLMILAMENYGGKNNEKTTE